MSFLGKVAAWGRFWKTFFQYRRDAERDGRFPPSFGDLWMCLYDRTSSTSFDPHYIYHTAWAARVLARTRPAQHVDVASAIYFVSIVSAFVPIRFYDYRPAELRLSGLESDFADLLALPFEDDSVPSLSCMHVIEHIGLGRYGDPVDAKGDLKAARELSRVLAPGGDLLVAVPVAEKSRCVFNAHRIYSFEDVKDMFSRLELESFVLVPDDAEHRGPVERPDEETLRGQRYACGCFHFRKDRQRKG